MLEIKKLETGYGRKQVLFGLTIEIKKAEITAIIGPNGAGKSTLLKAICGLIPVWNGEIYFNNKDITGSTPAQNINQGLTIAPQGGRVFNELTIMENLEIGGYNLPNTQLKDRIAQMFQIFPVLKGRARQDAGKLSGGEQQMLSLARALISNPKLLILDEPSLGLSQNLMKAVFDKIVEINKETGVSILIVEQKVREVLKISNCTYSLKLGKVAFSGPSIELMNNKNKLKQLFL